MALAAVLNLIGAFLSVAVAATIASGIVDQTTITVPIIFAGLVGAIVWNVITWYKGIPSSSSHALVGGVLGSVLAAEGSSGVLWSGLGSKVADRRRWSLRSCAARAAFVATRLAFRLTRSLSERKAPPTASGCSQILSSSLVALAHGTNDAQKTMGVIVLTLVAGGRLAAGAGVPHLGQGQLRGRGRTGHLLGGLAGDPHAWHARSPTIAAGAGFLGRDRQLDHDPGIRRSLASRSRPPRWCRAV